MTKLAHDVFFTLIDRSPEAVEQLVAACQKYLDNHDGVVDFRVGIREPELNRPVNADFDVALRLSSEEGRVLIYDTDGHLCPIGLLNFVGGGKVL